MPRKDSITGFQSDHGGEFIDLQVQQWAKDRNIAWHFGAPYIHQQNGKIRAPNACPRRKNQGSPPRQQAAHFSMARSNAKRGFHSPRNFLPYHGRRIDGSQSPYDIRYNRKPDVSFLSIIGSDVYVVLQQEQVRENPLGRHLAARSCKGKLVIIYIV
jgi:hypothetical protein